MSESRRLLLVNTALAHIGEEGYDTLEWASTPAKLAKVLPHVDEAVDLVLRRGPWLCALDWVTLTVNADLTGPAAMPHVFELPEDALRLWSVDGACVWQRGMALVGGLTKQVVRADAAGPLSVSIVRRAGLDVLEPLLFAAIGYELAARICGPVQGDYGPAAGFRREVERLVGLAAGGESGEERLGVQLVSSFAALRVSAG